MAEAAAEEIPPAPEGEGEAPADGEAPEEPVEEEEDWDKPMDELEILEKLGNIDFEAEGIDGMLGLFLSAAKYMELGLVVQEAKSADVYFSGKVTKPYAVYSREEMFEDIKKRGFASPWDEKKKDIAKAGGEKGEFLLMRDEKKKFGEAFCFPKDKKVHDAVMAKLKEKRDAIIEEYEDAKAARRAAKEGGGVVGEGGVVVGADGLPAGPAEDEGPEVFVYDAPVTPRAWESETAADSHVEVGNFTVTPGRALHQAKIEQPLKNYGAPCKYSDLQPSTWTIITCRQQKDPNFALNKRELECGIQAVPVMKETACMTQWFRPVNAFTQYDKDDFLDRQKGEDELLAGFLTRVSRPIEEALQQNETVDIFQDEFASLGEEDMGFGSKVTSNIKEVRHFQDVTFTRQKRVQWTEWVPGTASAQNPMLVSSVCDNAVFQDRVDNSGKAGISHVLIWSFQESLTPHAVIVSPWEVSYFKFWPTDKHWLIGGLVSGQMIFWKLTDEHFGLGGGKLEAKDEEKDDTVLTVTHKMLSTIDDAHRKPVIALEWLPAELEFEQRAKGRPVAKSDPDGPQKYFVTTSGDGQVLVWDFLTAIQSLDEPDFQWKPLHRAQLQRQDSGTEMGLCHMLYEGSKVDDKGVLHATNFWASTEEGELIYGDWSARSEDDRKPEFCKKMFSTSKTFRPSVGLQRSPFFPEILLSVTDWAFFLWKDGLKTHFFQSPAPASYFTSGAWSPTRPSVLFLGRADGALEIWDFSDQSHKHSLMHPVSSVGISNLMFLPSDEKKQDLVAVGDEQGHLRVLELPKNLVRPAGKELLAMEQLMSREEERVQYFLERGAALAALREEMEKAEQNAAMADTKAAPNMEAEDQKADAEYRKLEAAFLDSLGLTK
jgi:WD40 repeat protein